MSDETSGLTRRDVIKVGTAASLAGYAMGVEKVLAQAIKTDTAGITAGDAEVAIGSYNMPVYEARPASGGPAPIVVCISEVWGVHEWVRDMTRRFAKAGYYAVAPELFKREGGVGQLPISRTSSRSSSPCRASSCWATWRPRWIGPRSGPAPAPTAPESPAGAGAAPPCIKSSRPIPT